MEFISPLAAELQESDGNEDLTVTGEKNFLAHLETLAVFHRIANRSENRDGDVYEAGRRTYVAQIVDGQFTQVDFDERGRLEAFLFGASNKGFEFSGLSTKMAVEKDGEISIRLPEYVLNDGILESTHKAFTVKATANGLNVISGLNYNTEQALVKRKANTQQNAIDPTVIRAAAARAADAAISKATVSTVPAM